MNAVRRRRPLSFITQNRSIITQVFAHFAIKVYRNFIQRKTVIHVKFVLEILLITNYPIFLLLLYICLKKINLSLIKQNLIFVSLLLLLLLFSL